MSAFTVGQKIGGYEILGILGKGGMGTVYKANQTSMDRLVALKVLDPVLAAKDPSFCDRFIDEARAAGRLNHPNIIGVHDVSNIDIDGTTIYYFSMEVVEGENFKDIIERDGTVKLALAQQVAAKISDALLYAEQMNIVHRDIKPENIMLAKDGQIKLADLGLALQIDGEEEGTAQAGEDGKVKVMGTPRYMSPEQCRGKAVDHRSDQYCLGGSLFHMITGHPPYEGKSRKDLMRAQVLDPVPDPAELVDLPSAWRQLLMRMLAKKPEDRVPNAEALREAVRMAIAGEVYSPSRRGGTGTRRNSTKGSNNIFLYLIIAFVILATLGFLLANSGGNTAAIPDQTPAPSDPDDEIRSRARALLNTISPGDEVSHEEIREAIRQLIDVIKQGIFKPGDVGHQILENELARLEKLYTLKVSNLERELERKCVQIDALIISGKFTESNQLISSFSDSDKILLGKRFEGLRSSFNEEIDRRLKHLTDSIERAGSVGEIENVIKEAKIKQVYDFRRAQIDDSANKYRSIAGKREAQQQQQSEAANKRQDENTWKSLINELSRQRGTVNFDAFIKTASDASNSLNDSKLKDAAKAYADIGRQAKEVDSNLNEYLQQNKPQFLLQGPRPKNVRCIGLDADQYLILVTFPNDTILQKRIQSEIPVTTFLNSALSSRNARQRDKLISVYMSYWNHPYAGQYPNPFPQLDDDYPSSNFPQLETSKIDLPYNEKRFSADFSNPGLWLSQFNGKNFQFDSKRLKWQIDQAIGGNPKDITEDKLNFQTLVFQPELSLAVDLDIKFKIKPATFAMIGLRRGNNYVRLVFNTNDNVIGAVVTGPDKKLQIKPPTPIPASDILGSDIRLEISMTKDGTITFKVNGKDFTRFGGAANETFSLPGNQAPQLIFQGFKISSSQNGELEIIGLDVRQE